MAPTSVGESPLRATLPEVIKLALEATDPGLKVLAICEMSGAEGRVIFEGDVLSKVLDRFRTLIW